MSPDVEPQLAKKYKNIPQSAGRGTGPGKGCRCGGDGYLEASAANQNLFFMIVIIARKAKTR